MSSDPNVIRQQIETTRGELSSDVNALTDRVSPRRMATRRAGRVRGRLNQIKDRVMGTATQGREAAGQRATQARHRLTEPAQQAPGTITGAAQRASGAVSGTAHQAGEAATSVAGRARVVPQMSRERTEGNPLAAGLVAFGAGLLASSLIPPSQREQRLAAQAKQTAMERPGGMKQQAGSAARGMMGGMRDNLREPAQHAAQSVLSTAAEGASAVRDQGVTSARQLRD
jgi:hypothetical protein